MKCSPLVLIAVAAAFGCSDTRNPKAKEQATTPITGPVVAASPATITSASIAVSETGKKSTVCAVYLGEVDKAHAALVASPKDEAAAEQVQLFAKLATDACN